jgi:hypothetical protein
MPGRGHSHNPKLTDFTRFSSSEQTPRPPRLNASAIDPGRNIASRPNATSSVLRFALRPHVVVSLMLVEKPSLKAEPWIRGLCLQHGAYLPAVLL